MLNFNVMNPCRAKSLLFPVWLCAWVIVSSCAPRVDSDRYGLRNFAGRWEVVTRTRIDYLDGNVVQTSSDNPVGYLHFEVDRAQDDNTFYVSRALGETLAMLAPLRAVSAIVSLGETEEMTAYWDWGLDERSLFFIGKTGSGDVVSLTQISRLERDGMTLTYTETLSDSSSLEEVLVLAN
jgi:hypothetical protein